MSDIEERNVYLDVQDENGKVTRNFPMTKAENVIGLGDLLKGNISEDIQNLQKLTSAEKTAILLLAKNSYIVDDMNDKIYKVGSSNGKLYFDETDVNVEDVISAVESVTPDADGTLPEEGTSSGGAATVDAATKQQIEANKKNIATLSSKVNDNTETLSQVSNKSNSNARNITNLTSKVDANIESINNLVERVNQLSEKINNLPTSSGDGSTASITMDDELSPTSTNAVENQAIYKAISNLRGKNLTETLLKGNTSVSFTDDAINDEMHYEIYTNKFGLAINDIKLSGNTLIATFDEQDKNVTITLNIRNDSLN